MSVMLKCVTLWLYLITLVWGLFQSNAATNAEKKSCEEKMFAETDSLCGMSCRQAGINQQSSDIIEACNMWFVVVWCYTCFLIWFPWDWHSPTPLNLVVLCFTLYPRLDSCTVIYWSAVLAWVYIMVFCLSFSLVRQCLTLCFISYRCVRIGKPSLCRAEPGKSKCCTPWILP